MTPPPPTAAHRSLAELRALDLAFLTGHFTCLDGAEPAEWIASQALFFDGEHEEAIQFAVAVIHERLGVSLEDGEELSELALIELLDPAKGFPPIEVRAKAALMLLAMPAADATERRNHAYFANYLLDEPNIGLAVSMNDLRAKFGLEPTGW